MGSKVYQAIAQLIDAYNTRTSREGKDRAADRIERIVRDHMPHGSGFDNGTRLDIARSSDEKLFFGTSFHHMNEHGVYSGWTQHHVVVKPSLAYGFTLRIDGPNRNDIKDYISECFHHSLWKELTEEEDRKA